LLAAIDPFDPSELQLGSNDTRAQQISTSGPLACLPKNLVLINSFNDRYFRVENWPIDWWPRPNIDLIRSSATIPALQRSQSTRSGNYGN
jgi:hypothetical protein